MNKLRIFIHGKGGAGYRWQRTEGIMPGSGDKKIPQYSVLREENDVD
ncbi:hypothetical protein EC50588_0825 [Escherichia coli 5.0588]|nr:hypothetical protein EC50588_0825 [Escherichia coli 5.0588]